MVKVDFSKLLRNVPKTPMKKLLQQRARYYTNRPRHQRIPRAQFWVERRKQLAGIKVDV